MKVFLFLLFILPRVLGCAQAAAAEPSSKPAGRHEHKLTRYLLGGSVLVLGSAAFVFEAKSDREYSRYLKTAYPSQIGSSYDRAEKYRNFSNAALIGAEICAVGLAIELLREEPPKEPQPDRVRLSLLLDASHAGLSLRW